MLKSQNMFTNKRIMVIAAHPDDELLGLGATMHKLITECNVSTHVVILGEGITSRSDTRDVVLWKQELQTHQQNIKNAQQCIGYHSVSIYQFPDNRFDSVDLLDIIKVIEMEKQKFNPEIIFTHHGGDLNVDHRLTFEAAITATRPVPDEQVKMLITFETPSGTEWQASTTPLPFIPNMYIEVSEQDIKSKFAGMKQYEYEVRAYPHPRSIEALKIKLQNRGLEIGCKYAEAFHIVRLNI
jgi:LmbE family N-acetylglucosaminyl deacetylase